MRMRDFAGSLFLHAGLAAAVLAMPSTQTAVFPRIYDVSLAVRAPRSAAAPPLVEAIRPEATETSLPHVPEAVPPSPVPPPPPRPKSIDRPHKTVAKQIHPAPPAASPHPVASAVPAQSPVESATPAASTSPGPSTGGSAATDGLAAYGADAVDERPAVLHRVEPRYPEQARRRREEGKVLVKLVVDIQGRPMDCTVLTSEPVGIFDAAALEAVRRFRFRPGKLAGHSVATVVHIPFAFTLH